jgi:hypothetical protein
VHFPIALKYVPFETRYPPEWVYDPSAEGGGKMEMVSVPMQETRGTYRYNAEGYTEVTGHTEITRRLHGGHTDSRCRSQVRGTAETG